MPLIRQIHAYLGLFIAPTVLFFSLSGALQIFNLHEDHGSYHAPALIQTMGNLHKDQVLSKPDHDDVRGPPPGGGAAPKAYDHVGPPGQDGHEHGDAARPSTLLLKWFFELIVAGLLVSTLFGLWLGLRFTRTPRTAWGLLVAGVLVPVVILLL